ncbi:MAG: DNA-binding response regulator [Spirochaetaceae bacterium]|nr:MAG: DNA-binding response regulator [Spirochaetaceae bacterium]
MSTILVVDDEPDILELISYNLEKEGHSVTTVQTGEDALHAVRTNRPDVIILDLMLPGVDGVDVCRTIKRDPELSSIPVLMLTARTEDSDIVAGLEVGADDYITKPFSPKVLAARVRTALRRTPTGIETTSQHSGVSIHGITIDVSRHQVLLQGNMVPLSATEFAILEFLARNPGWVFSRMRIIDAIRGKDYPVTERSVDVQILGLRKKLGELGSLIETVRGVGYRMRAE